MSKLLMGNRAGTEMNREPKMTRFLVATIGCLAFAATIASADTLGRDWEGDSNDDAGDKPSTAQKVELDTFDEVKTIKGELKGEGL